MGYEHIHCLYTKRKASNKLKGKKEKKKKKKKSLFLCLCSSLFLSIEPCNSSLSRNDYWLYLRYHKPCLTRPPVCKMGKRTNGTAVFVCACSNYGQQVVYCYPLTITSSYSVFSSSSLLIRCPNLENNIRTHTHTHRHTDRQTLTLLHTELCAFQMASHLSYACLSLTLTLIDISC